MLAVDDFDGTLRFWTQQCSPALSCWLRAASFGDFRDLLLKKEKLVFCVFAYRRQSAQAGVENRWFALGYSEFWG